MARSGAIPAPFVRFWVRNTGLGCTWELSGSVPESFWKSAGAVPELSELQSWHILGRSYIFLVDLAHSWFILYVLRISYTFLVYPTCARYISRILGFG